MPVDQPSVGDSNPLHDPSHCLPHRRGFLKSLAVCSVAGFGSVSALQAAASHSHSPSQKSKLTAGVEEKSMAQLSTDMRTGQVSATRLVEGYKRRIEALDRRGPKLNSVLELNPDAVVNAAALDHERKTSGPRGPLHGIPVLLKDNIDTADRMMTTAGSLALVGSPAPRDAFLVERLRRAGAVLLGKTNLSEWANFRGHRSTSGWSGRGGQTRNPYALDRNPSGSSSGSAVAVAANLCAAAIGTETDGSIISPASFNGIVGLKPTVGLVSRSGIIPISNSQDTAGPMARTVADAALILGVIAGEDPRDPATAASRGKALNDYTRFLEPDGLRGARIGVVRRSLGVHRAVDRVMLNVLERMKAQGAELMDIELPIPSKLREAEGLVLLYEFKAGVNAYLESRGVTARVRTLADVIAFNERHPNEEMPWFGQELLIEAQSKGPLTDAAYREACETCRTLAQKEGLDAVMDRHQLDAIFSSNGGPAVPIDPVYGDRSSGGGHYSIAAIAGYPSITVPAGFVAGLPVSVSFLGRAWSEPVLLRIAHGFEQAVQGRRPPRFLAHAQPLSVI